MAENKSIDYTKLRAELDDIITSLQQADISVDAALKLHERAQVIITQLETYLSDAENRITQAEAGKHQKKLKD